MKTRFKELAILAIMAVFIPMSLSAQRSDGFFRSGDDNNYQNRETFEITGNSNSGLNNDPIGGDLPIGSGLLVMVATGAGYVVLKRRKTLNKKITVLLAFIMLMSFTQCKKKIETLVSNDLKPVNITLDVNRGSRVAVDPYDNTVNALVTYENGDVVYVGYGGKCVGTLTYNETKEKFIGSITATPDGQDSPLRFYFFGSGVQDKTYSEQYDEDDETYANRTVFNINISDQTGNYPVISYASSVQPFDPEVTTTYTATLQNKCSIVKFNVEKTGEGSSSNLDVIRICGVNNYVRVNLADPTGDNNGFSFYSSSYIDMGVGEDNGSGYSAADHDVYNGSGYIDINNKNTEHANEYWAIMLPQAEMGAGGITSVYTDDDYMGTRGIIPTIGQDEYKDTGISITIGSRVPANAFSVSPIKKIIIAPGNLQYNAVSKGSWRFAEHQYDIIGNNNNQISPEYNGWIDLFGWGTGNNPTNNSTNNSAYSEWHEWGDNQISGGGNYTWYSLSTDEFQYMFNCAWFNNTVPERMFKWTPATVNDVFGLLLLPDYWEKPDGVTCNLLNVDDGNDVFYDENGDEYDYNDIPCDYNSYSAAEWILMENNGAVFLPASGYRTGNNVSRTNDYGYYWSRSIRYNDNELAGCVCFQNWIDVFDLFNVYGDQRYCGYSVRLVRDITPSDK